MTAGYVRVTTGSYAGVIRNHDGTAVHRCTHRHTRSDLARACAEKTIREDHP